MDINPQISPILAFLIIAITVLFAVFLMEMYYFIAMRDINAITELMETI